MAGVIGGRRVLLRSLRVFERDFVEVARSTSERLTLTLTTAAGRTDAAIPRRSEREVLSQTGRRVEAVFVGADGRNAFDEDGVTALSPYARLLNQQIVAVTRGVVEAHNTFLRARLPEDVYERLRGGSAGRVVTEAEEEVDPEILEALRARFFNPNPLATYEPAHTWVDPRGYRLSDRVWATANQTRAQIDGLLAEGIRTGQGALSLSRRLEQFIVPGRAALRTKRPYGRDASYAAMRLARTEITRAHGQATMIASQMNPFVERIRWQLSGSHPELDECDSLAANGPYELGAVPPYPPHPHCLCALIPVVTARPAQVVTALRAMLDEADRDPALRGRLAVNPTNPDRFVGALLGLLR